MPTLSEYTNVYGTALRVLMDKGYQVWFDRKTNLFWAERDGWDFVGDSPTGLLGVIAIFEHRSPTEYKEYWWRKDHDHIDVRTLPDAPEPYNSVLDIKRPRPPRRE
jgi:hypothetical protein